MTCPRLRIVEATIALSRRRSSFRNAPKIGCAARSVSAPLSISAVEAALRRRLTPVPRDRSLGTGPLDRARRPTCRPTDLSELIVAPRSCRLPAWLWLKRFPALKAYIAIYFIDLELLTAVVL